MPIIERTLVVGLAVLALVLGAGTADAAGAPKAELVMKRMLADNGVRKQAAEYATISGAMMLYHVCPEAYKVDAATLADGNQSLNRSGQAYQAVLTEAHQALTGKLPDEEMLGRISAHLAAEQQQAALKVGLVARDGKQGCDRSALKNLDEYMQARRAQAQENQGSR